MLSPFKTLGAVLCLVFALCFAAPNAHADSFNATFTCLGTCASTPILDDNPLTFPTPTIDETWDGHTVFLILNPTDKPTDTYIWNNQVLPGPNPDSPTNTTIQFNILDLTTKD